MRKVSVIFLPIIALTLSAAPAPPEVVKIAEAYRSALQSRSIAPIEPFLAEDFDFSGAGTELSKTVFEQVLAMGVLQLGDISRVELEPMPDGHARAIIHNELIAGDMTHNATDELELALRDGAWKIVGAGAGALQVQFIQDPLTDIEFQLEGPAFSEIRFSESHDHIIINATLSGGDTVNFVIDNGTPISVIDSRIADRFEPLGELTAAKAIGVGGEIANTGAVRIDSIIVGELAATGLMAITMNLSHLSEALDIEIAGLLGTDFLGRFAWTIDYSARKLFLSRVADDGALLDPNDRILSREPTHTINFGREMHLLWTTAKFSPSAFATTILDCGAGGGVITPEFLAQLPESLYQTAGTDTLLGADARLVEVPTIVPQKLTIGPISRSDYPTVVSDLSHINSLGLSQQVSAIIGYNFFEDWLITTRFDMNLIELRPIPK